MSDNEVKLTTLQVAQLCHDLNRGYCWLLGDYSQPPFQDAPDWQVESVMQGVSFRLQNQGVTPEQMHENWMKAKAAAGWAYGPTKDPVNKIHPCFLPYDQLPATQRVKDYLFGGVVDSLLQAGVKIAEIS